MTRLERTDKLPCPFEDCGSSDAFAWYHDQDKGHCYSCGSDYPYHKRSRPIIKGIADSYDDNIFDEGETMTTKPEAVVQPILTPMYRATRGITKETMEKYGVQTFVNLVNNEDVKHEYPYTTGKKTRILPKQFFTSTGFSGDELFGMDKFNSGSAKAITITEGEMDAMSAYQMLGSKYPVVALPSATPSRRMLEKVREYLSSFDKIYCSFDSDGKADHLAEKLAGIFPNKVYKVPHTKFKDANEFLVAGAEHEYRNSWWSSSKMKPDNVLCTKDDFLSLYRDTPDYEVFATGLDELDSKMMGIHKGAFTVVLAETGIGKTEFFRYLEHQCITTTNYSLAFCHGEESQLRGILGLFSYNQDKNLIRKDKVQELGYEEKYVEFITDMTSGERVYQFGIPVGTDVEGIVDQVRFLAVGMGIDFIFMEPIQDFVTARSTSEKEAMLTELTTQLKRLAVELNVGIIIIAHANKEGEAKYCASIVQGAAFEIVLKRDTQNLDETVANTTFVYVGRKNRTGGGSGFGGAMYFDYEKFTLEPTAIEPPEDT
jgi:twinkle protein